MTESLCLNCRLKRDVHTGRSSFLLCQLSASNLSFPKYPRQPVLQCAGYQAMSERGEQERNESQP